MTRVLVFSDLWVPFPGGAERLAFNLSRHLKSEGMEVRALTGYENARQYDGPPVCAIPIGVGETHAQGAEALRATLAEWRPDVILTHHFYAREFQAELVATGVPIVQVVLNGHRIPEAAFAIYISDFIRREAGDDQPQDWVMTPPAFEDVNAGEHGNAIGFVKPYPHKGIRMIYRIARAMPRRRFIVLRGEWPTLEEVRPPQRKITLMAPVEDMREFYGRCRVMLMPSLSEDAGTVAQEATVNGMPCISSNVGGLPETNGGGILLDPENLGAWVQAIRALDEPGYYDEVVARQRAHLAGQDHAGALARFAEAVRRIA